MNKVKYVIFGIMLSLLFIIITSLFSNIHFYEKSIEFSENLEYEVDMNDSYNYISDLKTRELSEHDLLCLIDIEKLYNYSIKSYYDSGMTINEYFKENYSLTSDTLVSIYSDIYNSCSEYENSELSNKVVVASMAMEKEFASQMYGYEYNFRDYFIRTISEAEVFGTLYKNLKNTESDVIKHMLRMIGAKYE